MIVMLVMMERPVKAFRAIEGGYRRNPMNMYPPRSCSSTVA